MRVWAWPTQHAPHGASLLTLTVILTTSYTTSSLAIDQNSNGFRIDLRQLQSRTIDSSSTNAADATSSLQISFAHKGHHLSGFTSQSNSGFNSAQAAIDDPLRAGRNGTNASLQAIQSASSNRMNSIQGDLGMLLVAQRGERNDVQVSQSGNYNSGVIEQSGSRNLILGHQSGANNTVLITQAGTNQIIGYAQSGNGSTLTVRQR